MQKRLKAYILTYYNRKNARGKVGVGSQSKPKVSLIVPVFCVEKYIRQCIESLIHQTYQNLEIILVDDGSPDVCPVICDEYSKRDPRIIVIHKENEGVSKARNIGLDIATGDYIGFVDSDDYVDEKMYEKLVKLCEEYNTSMASVRYNEINEKAVKGKKCTGSISILDSSEYLWNMAFPNEKCFITASVWTNLYKKELITGIRFPEDRKIAEDSAFNQEAIVRAGEIVYLDMDLYHYRIRDTSVIHSEYSDYKRLLLELIPYYEEEILFYSLA